MKFGRTNTEHLNMDMQSLKPFRNLIVSDPNLNYSLLNKVCSCSDNEVNTVLPTFVTFVYVLLSHA